VPKLIHAADLHLDSPLVGLERYEGAPVSELRRATRDALDRLVELCVAERADVLVIAGDLFDGSWRDYSTGLFLCERMARLRDAGVEVVWIRGNHDAASRLRKHLRMPENVRELSHAKPESVRFEELNLVVHGQGFPEAAVKEDLTRAYPAPVAGAVNVGLLHTALDGREGHAPYAPCTLTKLVDRGYDYWALGHVHAHEVVSRAPFVVYPGNLQGRHVKETGPKGAVVVTFDSARVLEVEHRALDVVRFSRVSVDAGAAATLDDAADAVQRALRQASQAAGERLLAARVELVGQSAANALLKADPERALSTVRYAALALDAPVWIERAVVNTRPLVGELAAVTPITGPLGELGREIEALRADPAELAAFVAELPGLGELLRKLRPAGAEETLSAPEMVLDDARDLLLARLSELGEP